MTQRRRPGPAPGAGPDVGVLAQLRGKLVVSCQAPPGHPLAPAEMIAALCRCSAEGGAAGVRVDGAPVVRAVAAATGLPVIGLEKAWGTGHGLSEGRPAITPTVGAAVSLASAGAAIVAVEGRTSPVSHTDRNTLVLVAPPRPNPLAGGETGIVPVK